MRKELEARLFEKHKTFFIGTALPLTENLMPLGCDCGDGWYSLIDEVASVVDAHNRTAVTPVLAVEVKQKFGELRIYLSEYPDGLEKVTRAALVKSRTVCEECGSPGIPRGQGLPKRTLCDSCGPSQKT